MEKTISIGEKEEADEDIIKRVILGDSKVLEHDMPTYEIDLPENARDLLGVSEGDTVQFVEENGRVYLEKA